jgi:AmpE protein
MALISILFCLALQRYVKVGGWFQTAWFEAYLRMLRPWLAKVNEKVALLLIISPILVLLAIFHFIFKLQILGLFDLIMTTMILFFCIDARDLKIRLEPYFTSLEKGDSTKATNIAESFINDDYVNDTSILPRAITQTILLKSFEQVFSGLFWFMIFGIFDLGIYGVTIYFFMNLIKQHALKVNPDYLEIAKFAARIQNILEWLPSRLLGFTYALVGNFNKGCGYCSTNLMSDLQNSKKFAVDAGLAALDVKPEIGESDQNENLAALDIINRALMVWLVGMSLVLLGGLVL